MIDIHMHLIPGVDDGAENMEMSIVMMARSMEQGISQIIATPHSEVFRYSKEGGKIIFKRLLDLAAKVCPDMKLYLGCEVYCETGIMAEVLEALDSGRYPTMNGTKYVLMEFSQWVYPENTVPCVEALVNAGYKPIIAHMERYKYLRGNIGLVDRFREMGALIQINVYSLFDEDDDSIKNWARRLVQERKVDFLGTDAHRTYHRPPSAQWGLNWLYENVAQDYADAIAWENAHRQILREG
ncbi:MAG: hypothetical protein IKJ84_02515 [Oscillospiraceae bacterium]|nr:hypothetical protein [Oscillospiraceae bacterium]